MPTVLQSTATPNNQYLVWDRRTGAWVGTWEGDELQAAHLFTYKDGETDRGAVVGPYGVVRRLLVDNAWDDDNDHPGMVFDASMPASAFQSPSANIEATLEHYHGAWAAFAEADGVNERTGPHTEVPDPTQYRTFGATDYDLTNTNGDQLEPQREDYAVVVDEEDGVYISSASGLMFNERQTWVQKFRLRKAARSIIVRIETMRGYVGIRRVAAAARKLPFGRGRKT